MTSKEVRPNYISFPSKLHQKINQKNVDFLTIEIRSIKVRRNNVDFSLIEITIEESMWKLIRFFC